jgi:FemAB-related protein (PEP-CTERM system-associated)
MSAIVTGPMRRSPEQRDAVTVSELGRDTAGWDAFVRMAEDGTPFHLLAWRRAVERAFGHRAHYLVARRGDRIEGVLPLFRVRGLLGGVALVSVPYAVYGGICATSDEARHALLDAATTLGRAMGASYVELRHRRDQGLDLPTKSLYVTFRRAIAKDDDENLLAIPRKQRRMTKQGEKHGLHADTRGDHLDAFYEIYAQSVQRLGSPVFPPALLRAIRDEFGPDCELLGVWQNERLLAGVLTIFYEDEVLPYYGGALPEALPYAVNDFMYWELMRHAARKGCRIFDFGRSRTGTGSYDFKRHWGFEPVPLPYQYVLLKARQMPDLSPSNRRFDLVRRLWTQLPPRVARILGPVVTRYLP